MTYALFISVFVIATCGLVYELVAGALASYLLGDSVLQFSTVIGAYLFSMGIGSYLSRFIERGLIRRFIEIEIAVGLVGGFSAAYLLLAFSSDMPFRLLLYVSVGLVGILVGLEVPLLIRILKGRIEFRDLIAKVLTVDYVGALAASILFPLLLVPKLGLLRSALVFGLANVAVAALALYVFRDILTRAGFLRVLAGAAAVALIGGIVYSNRIYDYSEGQLYSDEIVFARSSRYQRIVLTRRKDDLRLYLNGHLQFSSRDEYRYHESLVHPALAGIENPRDALVLGGGDGMAVREILRHPGVEHVTLVDLDPDMTRLFSTHSALVDLNGRALQDPRVRVINADAFQWLRTRTDTFDLIIADFPDPSNYSLGKLYTTLFYRSAARRLRPGGVLAVQATSPLFARHAYWCIVRTMREAGFAVTPYHVYVPTFGEWGFIMGTQWPYAKRRDVAPGLKFLNEETWASLFEFPNDMAPVEVLPNRLETQMLVRYYEDEWKDIVD